VLSIGGFLGMGAHLVAVPYDSLKFVDKKFVLPGGTKEGLKLLPEFKYASNPEMAPVDFGMSLRRRPSGEGWPQQARDRRCFLPPKTILQRS
jgi:hypothetical protein